MERLNAPRTYQTIPIKQESYDNFPNITGNYPNQYEYPVMLSTHQMVDIKQEDYNFHVRPSDTFESFIDQYTYHMLASSASDPNLHQFMYDDRTNAQDQDQFTLNQFHNPNSNFELSGSTASGDFITQIEPSNMATGIVLDEYEENLYFADSHMVDQKMKDPEVTAENYYIANEPAYPNLYPEDTYLNSRHIPRTGPSGGIHSIHSRNSASRDFIETETLPAISGFNAGSIWPSPQFHHRNCMVQHPYSGFLQHPGNWNYPGGLTHINDGQLHPGAMGSLNMHQQDHPNASININSAFMHPYLQPVPEMQVHAYSQYTHVPAPSYWQFFGNLRAPNGFPHTNVDSTSRFPETYESVAESILSTLPEVSYVEDPEMEEYFPEYYSSEDSDSEARLDVDHMTYEELLALGDHIGHVSTGLSEDSILKNLNIRMCAPRLDLSLSVISTQSPGETCGICLDEYKANEKIGMLDCGHSYHADCIKKWLLIKNMCPICKEPALSISRRRN